VTIIEQISILRTFYTKLFMYGHMCFTINTFLPVSSKTCNTMKWEQLLYIWSWWWNEEIVELSLSSLLCDWYIMERTKWFQIYSIIAIFNGINVELRELQHNISSLGS